MSDPIVSKDTLLKPRLTEGTVAIPGVGTVRIRSLSRAEVLTAGERDRTGWEVALLAAGVVEPDLTEDEVRQWRENAPPDTVNVVAEAILGLSGMLSTAVGEAKRSFPEEPGA